MVEEGPEDGPVLSRAQQMRLLDSRTRRVVLQGDGHEMSDCKHVNQKFQDQLHRLKAAEGVDYAAVSPQAAANGTRLIPAALTWKSLDIACVSQRRRSAS